MGRGVKRNYSMPAPPHKVHHKPCQAGVLIFGSFIDLLDHKLKMNLHPVRRPLIIPLYYKKQGQFLIIGCTAQRALAL